MSADPYFMKSPPVQYDEATARDLMEKFIKGWETPACFPRLSAHKCRHTGGGAGLTQSPHDEGTATQNTISRDSDSTTHHRIPCAQAGPSRLAECPHAGRLAGQRACAVTAGFGGRAGA
jgi:hypothetical protein